VALGVIAFPPVFSTFAPTPRSLTRQLVVALVALVAVGGATRVMEAGLACPDGPLCYGSLLPTRQMNLLVFELNPKDYMLDRNLNFQLMNPFQIHPYLFYQR
jgi:heme A synthase